MFVVFLFCKGHNGEGSLVHSVSHMQTGHRGPQVCKKCTNGWHCILTGRVESQRMGLHAWTETKTKTGIKIWDKYYSSSEAEPKSVDKVAAIDLVAILIPLVLMSESCRPRFTEICLMLKDTSPGVMTSHTHMQQAARDCSGSRHVITKSIMEVRSGRVCRHMYLHTNGEIV